MEWRSALPPSPSLPVLAYSLRNQNQSLQRRGTSLSDSDCRCTREPPIVSLAEYPWRKTPQGEPEPRRRKIITSTHSGPGTAHGLLSTLLKSNSPLL